MAADQRKRRLSSATALGYGLQGQYRAKKRDVRSLQNDYNFSSHILLKWDDNGKRVVAKDDQVGISWRHLSSFVTPTPCSNSKLADVISVPREIFQLNDLTQVLSFEVWQSLLTEKERNYLLQFLPRGFEPDQLVQALLSGDNFYFGNPSLKWGASVCSGDVHPDAIIHHEKSSKANKKAYYSKLQEYHDNMIRNLQKLKERCASSKDPDAEILQMMSRPRRYAEKSNFPVANGHKSRRPEENIAAISESPSSIADDKSYFSDNQKLSTIRDAEIQKRIHSEEVTKDKHEKLVACTNGVKNSPKLKKAEKLQKVNINLNDGARYMSYVKISKKQHELVTSMKQSGSSIQSKTLNRVLGNLDSFNVKPYEMFVEEEQMRIHEFWSNLANKYIPAALHNWRNMQSEKRQIMDSLLHEVEEKQMSLMEDDKVVNFGMHLQVQDEELGTCHDEETVVPHDMDEESSQGTSERHQDDVAGQGSISDDDNPSSMQHESPMPNPTFGVCEGYESTSLENQCSVQDAPLNVTEESYLSPVQNQSSGNNPRLNVNKELNPMDLNAETNNVTLETSDFCSTLTEGHAVPQASEACHNVPQPESDNPASAANPEEMPCSSVKNVWASIGLPESYPSIATSQYASVSEPSLGHPQVVSGQPARLIDLESDLPEEDATKDLLNRHTNHIPFFNPYPNRDRSELLQSLIKHDNYQQEQKKTGLEFNPATDVLLEPGLFPGHFREQLPPSFGLDNRQKSQSEQLYMNQNIHDGLYPDSRYSVQGQGHFSTLNVRDWSNARIPTSIQPPQLSSGELLNHNWFGSENRAHGGWSGSDGTVFSHPSLASGNGGDQSLYSVLSQCSTLRSRAPYNPVGSTDQIIPSTNYGQDMAGGIPMTSSSLPQTGSPFDYLGGTEAAGTLKNTNLSWMSLGQQQNPGLHDPSGKPFLKSWNQ